MAYADDITLFSLTTSGLQTLIDLCADYANTWRFNFGLKKSKCMSVDPKRLTHEPNWSLDGNCMENVDSLEILGVTFDNKCNGISHVKVRSTKCRRAYYSMSSVGMNYPGLSSDAKSYIWKSVCLPSLTYGVEAISINDQAIKQLDSLQGSLIKQCLGISKSSHRTHLCLAFKASMKEIIKQRVLALWHSAFKTDSPTRDLCTYWLSIYVHAGKVVPGTLLSRVLKTGVSPTRAAFNHLVYKSANETNGVTDSLHYLITHKNFIKPWSKEYAMAKLITRSFT